MMAFSLAACSGNKNDNAAPAVAPTAIPEVVDTARTIRVLKVEGDNAVITRNGSETAARDNLLLSDGNATSTGQVSNIYFNLNSKSVMNCQEEIYISIA